MSESLGKATLELSVDIGEFSTKMDTAHGESDQMRDALAALAEVSKIAEDALKRVAMSPSQAAESDAAGDVIDRKLKDITGNANEARRAIESVKLSSVLPGGLGGLMGGGGGGGGIGIPGGLGSGAGGALGGGGAEGGGALGGGALLAGAAQPAAVALLAPAAGPAVAGLLASIPVLAASGAGALGTLALAFDGVSKAIGGDKAAYADLVPAQKQFVDTVSSLEPVLDKLKQTAGTSMFPGLTAGLKAALSPGTLGAITTAVQEFGHAIGAAGEQWGKYFGSAEFQSIFGPLMKAGAANLKTMSGAALSLFDAIGVLGRAAIPFTSWMTKGIADASRLADSWMHAKDASGALSGAMGEAETSLRLVGGLLESVLKAVGALGEALYPVSKVAVKGLTDGLNALAGIINRNQGVIREIIGTALVGLVETVKLASGAIGLLVGALGDVIGKKAPLVATLVAIGVAMLVAMGPESVAITGAVLAVGEIVKHWTSIRQFFAGFFAWIGGAARAGWDEVTGSVTRSLADVKSAVSHTVGVVDSFFGSLPGRVGSYAKSIGLSFVKELGAGLSALGAMLDQAIKTPINDIISAWDSLHFSFTVPSLKVFGHKIGGESISFAMPQIPQLDTGGTVLETGLAVVHRGEDWSGVGANRRWGGGGDVVLQVDGRELARINANTLSRDSGSARVTAKAIDPHLARIVKVGG